MTPLPRLLITMGDVAGVGPEIIARAWPELLGFSWPTVVGDPECLESALRLVNSPARVTLDSASKPAPHVVPCLVGSGESLRDVPLGCVSAAAGKASYDFLCTAIAHTFPGGAEGIVTAPLNKEALHAAGLPYPGHTEILAERTGTKTYAMLLYAGSLAVAHATLHMALVDVFAHLTTARIHETARVLGAFLDPLLGRRARIGVAALNPHAGEAGLFGDEEARLIRPAVEQARARGLDATGPWPSDTLFARARRGEFDGVVAMYHDQGHIAMKLLGGLRTVNVTAGLPLIRTSPAHGTAYDIAGKGIADATGLIEAARLAARLARPGEHGS